MKWLWITLPVVSLFLAVPALAQNKSAPNKLAPNKSGSKTGIAISPGDLAPTQEMWFYQQYQKEYMDPKTTVRQKAEFRAEERQRRLAARRWYGFSNLRPTANVDWIDSDPAPHWASGNVYLPFQWNGPVSTTVHLKPTAPVSRTY